MVTCSNSPSVTIDYLIGHSCPSWASGKDEVCNNRKIVSTSDTSSAGLSRPFCSSCCSKFDIAANKEFYEYTIDTLPVRYLSTLDIIGGAVKLVAKTSQFSLVKLLSYQSTTLMRGLYLEYNRYLFNELSTMNREQLLSLCRESSVILSREYSNAQLVTLLIDAQIVL